ERAADPRHRGRQRRGSEAPGLVGRARHRPPRAQRERRSRRRAVAAPVQHLRDAPARRRRDDGGRLPARRDRRGAVRV
ncbi:MAG: hypothetical protein AVDCRST_MAG19-3569, partial [uncultured Thermomicrobiales bacterium]